MYFSALPEAYASIGEGLCYTLSDCSEEEVTLIVRRDDGQWLGAKRFIGSPTCTIDIAPMLRGVGRFDPKAGTTGFHEAQDRSITVQVEAETEQQTLICERRTFLYTAKRTSQPSLLRSLPRNGLLGVNEWEELTFIAPEPLTITVTTHRRGVTTQSHYTADEGGVQLFRIAASDFPEADAIDVEAPSCGKIHYTCSTLPAAGVRLAWRSTAGSIEHFTFPTIEQLTHEVDRSQSYTAEGYQQLSCTVDERMMLGSPYLDRATAHALSELLTTEQAWCIIEGVYQPIDVITRQATLHRHGEFDRLLIEVRSAHKNQSLWS